MTAPGAAAPPAPSRRRWLTAIGGALLAVLVVSGYVQWRQYELLDATSSYQNDALGWSFSQLETEQLRLRNHLQMRFDDPSAVSAESVQLRYDIFVSRVGLVDHARAARIMEGEPAYQSAMAGVRDFVRDADRVLGTKRLRPLDSASVTHLLASIDTLNAPLHDLSLAASHLLYQRVTARNLAVRQQSRIGIALTAFQCLLLVALAAIAMRQFAALTERRRSLEKLAGNLDAARTGAEAANRAKSAFLANMSHEIRTPFHGMLGMMSLLQASGLDAQQASHLETARESAQHLLRVLNDILDVSQLESGSLQVVPAAVDLPQLVAQVDALIRAQAISRGLALRTDLAPDVPRWVSADATRVKQILFNLLGNAIKFTKSGTVSLDVTWAVPTGGSSVTAAGAVVFTVADPGIGMAPALVEQLFRRFTVGDDSAARQRGGAGLGLEIARDLTRLMGGEITVRSEVGVGSTFTATLPLPPIAAPTHGGSEADSAAAAAEMPSLRVLVAEDHAVNRAYMEAVLDKLGHRAAFSPDGAGAIRALEDQPPGEPFDIVLMDLHMPGMDGFAAARAIRAMPPPAGRVPIVALTADVFQEARERARDAGMDGFLTKPAHLPQLREALLRYGAARMSIETPARPRAPPTATAPAAPADLDPAVIGSLLQVLPTATYRQLLGTFFAGRAATLGALRRAAAARAPEALREEAHALKGAALNLGLHRLAAWIADTPAAGVDADATEDAARLERWVDEAERRFDAAEVACRQYGHVPAATASTQTRASDAPTPTAAPSSALTQR
jgi:two-component system, sensor histidine kinase